ncbi:MAG: hypothetical protein HY026_09315 [Deltaproteobacteria bacterium]|nr:hypothetical protein [Deltaproteobacteria bacterium]
MDKVELLRHLSKSDFFPLLSKGELKLYILLLARADDVDAVCKISFKQIEKIGRRLAALKKLKSSMASLEKYGLAAFEKIEEWPYGELRFRLKRPLPAVSGQMRAKRDRRVGWQRN